MKITGYTTIKFSEFSQSAKAEKTSKQGISCTIYSGRIPFQEAYDWHQTKSKSSKRVTVSHSDKELAEQLIRILGASGTEGEKYVPVEAGTAKLDLLVWESGAQPDAETTILVIHVVTGEVTEEEDTEKGICVAIMMINADQVSKRIASLRNYYSPEFTECLRGIMSEVLVG